MSDLERSPQDDGDLTAKLFADLSITLGLPKPFLDELFNTHDDWTFVVKAHALLESAVCAWLTADLARPELEAVLANRVDMMTRIKMLSALNLGTSEERGWMMAFGELRNGLVHTAQGTQFTFEKHLANRDVRKSFCAKFSMSTDLEPIGAWAHLAVFHALLGVLIKTADAKSKPTAQMYLDALIEKLTAGGNAPAATPVGDKPKSRSEGNEE